MFDASHSATYCSVQIIWEPLIKSGRIILGCKIIKIKARNASNSRAIAKFCNAEIDYFVPQMIGHDLIRGSLDTAASVVVANRFGAGARALALMNVGIESP